MSDTTTPDGIDPSVLAVVAGLPVPPPTPDEIATEAIAQLRAKMGEDKISGAQLASLSGELRHWLELTEPAALSVEWQCRAAMTLLEHGSRGRTVATQALIAAVLS